jgi:serine/threonine protein kinase
VAHPHIAQFYELFTHREQDFIVMEFVPGATLHDVLKTGPLPTEEVLRLGMQMMQAVAAAHTARVIHRDVKPGNMKITSSGALKVLDFGLARFKTEAVSASASTDTAVFEIVGTAYTSPERLRGEPADQRADIFGAGAVLFEMATGRRAFDQHSLPHLLTAILLDPPPSPTRIYPLAPESLSRIITKMLEKEPGDRYTSASHVVEDLQRLVTTTAA